MPYASMPRTWIRQPSWEESSIERTSLLCKHKPRTALDRFADVHLELVQFAQANTVANTINTVISTIGFWDEAAALRQGEATTARLNIARFLGVAQRWRPIEGQPTVRRFLRYIDALNESDETKP